MCGSLQLSRAAGRTGLPAANIALPVALWNLRDVALAVDRTLMALNGSRIRSAAGITVVDCHVRRAGRYRVADPHGEGLRCATPRVENMRPVIRHPSDIVPTDADF